MEDVYKRQVIEIPKTMHYWGIIKHVLTCIYDMETAKLTYFKTTHDSLGAVSYTHLLQQQSTMNFLQQ